MSYYSLISLMPKSTGIDPDAQAFITAAAITDPTQQSAINQLVVDLKGYNIWTKMKGIWPFVGGTSSTHKWNLKDPRDLDVAFRLVFNGGWTHSANGALPNGTNGYANTFITPSTNLISGNVHASIYNRTNTVGSKADLSCSSAPDVEMSILSRFTGDLAYPIIGGFQFPSYSNTDSRGFWTINRQNTTNIQYYNKNVKVVDAVQTNGMPTNSIYIGAANVFSGITRYSDRQIAFSSVGEGLSATEVGNLYTAVQAFQVTLGRSIGTQTVSDADAQAFVTNAGIVDQVEANAINNLVIGLKADGLWTKMKVVYPFIGSSAGRNAYNLKNTAQYYINWNGGVTHPTTGVQFGGVNGYGDTNLNLTALNKDNIHFSFYSRTNNTTQALDMGQTGSAGNAFSLLSHYSVDLKGRTILSADGTNSLNYLNEATYTNSTGLLIGTRQNSNNIRLFRNGVKTESNTNNSVAIVNSGNIFIGARNQVSTGLAANYTDRQAAFISIGDNLTDTDAANLTTRVNNFQTTLGRQV